MYRVPATASLDKSLRRAIAAAVALCSVGAALLVQLMSERTITMDISPLIDMTIYLGLLAACWYAGTRGWTRVLYALAAFGLALGIAVIAIRLGLLLHFTPRSPWRWSRLSVPGLALLIAPVYIRRFWNAAGTRAGQG